MVMEQMLECLLAEIRINQAKMDSLASQMDVNHASHEEMKALTGSLASQMDVNQEKTEACHKQMKARQEKVEAAIHFIQSELEETIKLRMEDVLACVDQRMQGLHKELYKKTDEMQVDLQAGKTSFDMRMKDFLETTVDTTKDLHEELGLMTQVEIQATKP
jgi:hypothetical protein